MVYLRGRGLVENEEQEENKKMKSIVVEEQEQEQEEGSETETETETGFVDLDWDTLLNVLERVDAVTLGRAACVNKLWREVARDKRLWEPFVMRLMAIDGMLEYIDGYRSRSVIGWQLFRGLIRRRLITDTAKPASDFYSIDFWKMIKPWVQNQRQNLFFIPHTEEVTHNRG